MAINLEETLSFEERVNLAMGTKSHTKKLDLLKAIKRDIEFDISEAIQMAQILAMTHEDDESVSTAIDNIAKLSEQNKWISGEIIKEENAIAEYDYARKHHPVVTASKNIVKGVEDGMADMKASSDEIKDKIKNMSKKKQKAVVEEFSIEDNPIINATMVDVLTDATPGPEPEPAM